MKRVLLFLVLCLSLSSCFSSDDDAPKRPTDPKITKDQAVNSALKVLKLELTEKNKKHVMAQLIWQKNLWNWEVKRSHVFGSGWRVVINGQTGLPEGKIYKVKTNQQ